jgi:hypothetical protein
MVLTKIQIIGSLWNQTGFSKNNTSEILDTLLGIIKGTFAPGLFCKNQGKLLLLSVPGNYEIRLTGIRSKGQLQWIIK